jgi:signal peptidase I
MRPIIFKNKQDPITDIKLLGAWDRMARLTDKIDTFRNKLIPVVTDNRLLIKFTQSILDLRELLSQKFKGNIGIVAEEIKSLILYINTTAKYDPASENQAGLLLQELNDINTVFRPFYIRRKIKEWIESIIIAFLLAMVIRSFVVQAFKIPTGSMRPTLLEGDLILVNKFIYGARVPFTDARLPALAEPQRGDIIVFIFPGDRKKDFIKRLVGLPGDAVEIKRGTIYINDKPVLDAAFSQRYYYNRGDYAMENKKISVPKDSYFVLGDNSGSSMDSRYWGFVPKKDLLGKAMIIYFPPQRIRLIK